MAVGVLIDAEFVITDDSARHSRSRSALGRLFDFAFSSGFAAALRWFSSRRRKPSREAACRQLPMPLRGADRAVVTE